VNRADLKTFAANHRADFENWLSELVAIPSVSVDPAHAADVQRCAEAAAGFSSTSARGPR
jgi:hypothetical protein